MSVVLLIVLLALGLALIMAAAWAIAVRTGNSGWADAFWTYSIGLGGLVAALVPLEGVARDGTRALVVAALVVVWSLRLGTHIVRRTLGGGDDPRYAQLRKDWGESWKTQLLLFLEIQAACALLLVLAVMAAANNPAPFGPFDILGILVAVVAIIGEGLSDAQLRAFTRDLANKGKVCDVGLWGLSRHPNYFFEWLYWLAYPHLGISLVVAHPWGWFTLVAPVLMYVLLVHLSGIPPLEQHMLRSRGDAFRAYQQRVSAFWPVPKGRS
jgi:steroid 5-alpha reductase family enzyme